MYSKTFWRVCAQPFNKFTHIESAPGKTLSQLPGEHLPPRGLRSTTLWVFVNYRCHHLLPKVVVDDPNESSVAVTMRIYELWAEFAETQIPKALEIAVTAIRSFLDCDSASDGRVSGLYKGAAESLKDLMSCVEASTLHDVGLRRAREPLLQGNPKLAEFEKQTVSSWESIVAIRDVLRMLGDAIKLYLEASSNAGAQDKLAVFMSTWAAAMAKINGIQSSDEVVDSLKAAVEPLSTKFSVQSLAKKVLATQFGGFAVDVRDLCHAMSEASEGDDLMQVVRPSSK